MTLSELLPELLKLNRQEMVQVIQVLQRQVEASAAPEAASYEVWSPQITAEGASILQEMLNEAKRKDAAAKNE